MAHLPRDTFHPRSSALVPATRAVDTRTEQEIVTDILACPPVADGDEKNVWTFWDKGWDAMRPWARRNVVDWARKLRPAGWSVRVLDTVPGSPRNVTRFVDEVQLPVTFKQMSGQHASDVMRVLLLDTFGGFWFVHRYIDVW